MGKEENTVMEEQQGEVTEKRGKASRVFAVIGLVILAALFVWFIVCLITGSPRTLAVLVLLILYPIILYLFFWVKKTFSKD